MPTRYRTPSTTTSRTCRSSAVVTAFLAWGGLLGRGWGLGRPGLTLLAKSDFIAAAIGEELGIAGLMAIILVYGIIVSRGLRTALAAREPFGKLLSAGLSFVSRCRCSRSSAASRGCCR